MGPPHAERDDRGQTAADFALGVTVFLLAVVLVFSFLPGMSAPYTTEASQGQQVDRIADRLTTDVITDPRSPTDLNETCTERFFNGTVPRACPYELATDGNLTTVVGVSDAAYVNVTVERRGRIARLNVTGNETELAIGSVVPQSGVRVTDTQRIVRVNGSAHRLRVRVW